ncbi:hypothetical protein V6N11_011245 [Hibiscus sabdariffa]|uniref:Reverse transcriptase n=1 Tax=Hibiscus sabdariffa TaxID=183260 RepID=A0ABR2S8C7_9ROSI
MASTFFQDLFHTSAPVEALEILNLIQPRVTEELNMNLMAPFHPNEIRINIWDEPWIPGPGGGRVRCNAINIQYNTLSDLIEEADKSWKYDVIKDLFDAEQGIIVRKVVIGCYALSNLVPYLLNSRRFFTEIWAVDVPAKVKITMWRIVNNFLPTFHNLQMRRLSVHNVCPLCQSHSETVEHLLRDCVFVKQVMRKLALLVVSIQVVGLWKDWVVSYFATLTARNKRVLLVLYWSIWFSRNKVVHEGIHTSTDESMTFVEAYIRERDTLGRMLPKAIPVRESYWQAPSKSVIKFNFDSAFNSRSGYATTGVIGRNNRGLIMAACSFPHRDVVDAFAADAYACKQAVLLVKDLGFLRVIIEGNSLTLIKKLISDRADRTIIYPIVCEIKILARSFTSISFCFVRREVNNAAHVLARECRGYLVPRYWMEEAPETTTVASELDRRRLPESHIL